MRTVLMFAGQGTQYYRMGRGLYEHDPAYRAALDRCDAACGPISGRPVSQVILGRPVTDTPAFDRQSEVTPALLAVGYALAQALFARGLRADLLLGSSFGETIASVVAGTLSLDAGFRLVRDQAALIEAVVPPGAMVAVLGAWDTLRLLPEVAACTLAAVNSPRHFVLALAPHQVAPLLAALARRTVPAARLPVRHAFHGPALDPARDGLLALAAANPRAAPSIPMVSCGTAARYDHTRTDHFWQVARGPIRFAETVRTLAAEGPCRFIEAGPGGSLATFVRQTLGPAVSARPAINQLGDDMRTMAALFD